MRISAPGSSRTSAVSFQLFETPLELFSKMRQGLVDATVISSVSAKKIADESNGQVRVCAVVSDIDFKILTRKKGNIDFSDLIGNKIYVAGEGFAQKLLLTLLGGAIYVTFEITWTVSHDDKRKKK